MNIEKRIAKAKQDSKGNKRFFHTLKKRRKREVDTLFHQSHNEVFKELDCLTCANCCKTTSPIFTRRDIERLSKHLGMTAGMFQAEYLIIDEDDDFVLHNAPCPFLNMEDNKCEVYDHRPKACREYPHTDRKNMIQILDLTHRNTMVCPAVQSVVEKIRNHMQT